MNYITEINKFYDWLETNDVPKSAVALWNALMHINNKAEWKQTFEVAISTLEFKTKFKRSELFEARNILTQKGRIRWKSRGGSLSASYEIISFCVHNTDANPDAKGYTNPDTNAYSKRTQKGTINKQDIDKTKLNKTTTGADAQAVEKKVLVNPFSEEFLTEWQIWRDYKKSEHRFGFKSVESEQAAINELVNLSGGSEETAKAIIRQSLAKGWKGLFHLKNDSNGQAGAKNGQPGAGKSKATSAELHALHLKRFGKAG